MTGYKGANKIDELYVGSTKIGKVYKGSTLVYDSKIPAGTVIFESSTAGTYTVNITSSQNYYIELVGGGASGRRTTLRKFGGGSGAYVYGTQYITKGAYTVIIGAGQSAGSDTDGGDSSFNSNIAGGGKNSYSSRAGGTYSTSLNGINGNAGGESITANSVYDNTSSGYGAGGYSTSTNSISGYAKIVAV